MSRSKKKTTAPRWTAAKAKNRWPSAAGNAPEQSASCWAPPNLHKGAGFQYFNISTHPILKKQIKPAVTAAGPKQTLIPLAQRLDLIISADWLKGQEAELCRTALSKPGTSLISWQHELIPDIAAAIPGGNIPQRAPERARFDLVWVFDLFIGWHVQLQGNPPSIPFWRPGCLIYATLTILQLPTVNNSGAEHHGCHS